MSKFFIVMVACAFFSLLSCNEKSSNEKGDNKEKVKKEKTEETKALLNDKVIDKEDEETSSELDLNEYTKNLKGIEKYFARKSLLHLVSLLKYHGDNKYLELEKHLTSNEKSYPLVVTQLDAENGYIKYEPYQTEVSCTQVYWNKTNGEKLIGTTSVACGPICECEISFAIYNEKKDTYTDVEPSKIIEGFESLESHFKIPEGQENDPHEFMFYLPQKGKNIKFCFQFDYECIELVWKDGTFTVKK